MKCAAVNVCGFCMFVGKRPLFVSYQQCNLQTDKSVNSIILVLSDLNTELISSFRFSSAMLWNHRCSCLDLDGVSESVCVCVATLFEPLSVAVFNIVAVI